MWVGGIWVDEADEDYDGLAFAELEQFPNCCGIGVLCADDVGEGPYHELTNAKQKKMFKKAVKEKEQLCLEARKGGINTHHKYGILMAAHTSKTRVAILKKMSYKEITTFKNPKTNKNVTVLWKKLVLKTKRKTTGSGRSNPT